jgi:hypothetical protein
VRKARFTAFLLLAVLFMSLAVPVSADAIGGSLYIGDLAAGTATTNSLAINWTTPSGTAPAPGAAYYDIRYSTVPITDTSSFNAAVPLGGVPAPLAAGSGQSFTINGLACGTKYYFAITAYNAAKSGVLSNSASGSTTACSLTFSVAAAITGGSSFYQIQKGDFNNDGKPDIVVSVTNTKSIIFYPGTGSGTFGAPVTSSGVTGTYPMKPIAGDFNGDGKLDLAVPNFSDNTVSILFGDGNGNFTSHGTFPTGSGGPQEAVVGDFNRDGKLDIAIAMWDTGDIKIYLGDGTGTFAHSSTFHVFDDARLLALRTADFDGDGIPDLVVADYGYGPSSYKNRIRVMKGNGSGGFSSTDADIYTVGLQPQSIAIGDLNGDGKPDIVCVSMDGTVAVLLNNGDGTFAPATTYAVGVQLYSARHTGKRREQQQPFPADRQRRRNFQYSSIIPCGCRNYRGRCRRFRPRRQA